MRVLKNAVAGLLVATFPVTASAAAVQAGSALPLAASAATTAALEEEGAGSSVFPWAPLLVIALTIGLGIYIGTGSDESGEDPFSPG